MKPARKPAMVPSGDPLMTVPEVAEFLRVAPRTVREWAQTGRLPSIRIGEGRGCVRRFERTKIEAWVAAHVEGVAK